MVPSGPLHMVPIHTWCFSITWGFSSWMGNGLKQKSIFVTVAIYTHGPYPHIVFLDHMGVLKLDGERSDTEIYHCHYCYLYTWSLSTHSVSLSQGGSQAGWGTV